MNNDHISVIISAVRNKNKKYRDICSATRFNNLWAGSGVCYQTCYNDIALYSDCQKND